MPRLPRTADLLAALAEPGTATRCAALVRAHGRAALRDARAMRATRLVLPRIVSHRDQAEAYDTRVAALMEWLPTSVALTGLAACAKYGLLEHPPQHLRAAAPSGLHVRSPRWLTLRRCIVPSGRQQRGDLRLVTVAEALVHAWEEDADGGAREAIFAALREGLTTVADIKEALSYYPRVRGRARMKAFLAHLLDGMHSYLEYRAARTVLNTPDLKGLEYQVRFVIEGNVFYVDRYDPVTRTAVELDSKRWHGTPEARARDAWRDGLLASVGVATVRLLSTDVFSRVKWSRATVRAAIASRAAPP